MLIAIRAVFITKTTGEVMLERRYATVELRGKRLCKLHGLVYKEIPKVIKGIGEGEFVGGADGVWPVVQLVRDGLVYCVVPLVSQFVGGQKDEAVALGGCYTILESLAEFVDLCKAGIEEEDLFDRLLVYLSTIIPMGALAGELCPAKWLKAFGYVQPPTLTSKEEKAHQACKLQLVEYHYGELNCGSNSYPSVVGKLFSHYESQAHTAPNVPMSFAVAGNLQDLTLSADIAEERQNKENGTVFKAQMLEGQRMLLAYTNPAPLQPAVKGSFKAYLPKEGSSTLDIRFQLNINLTPLEWCKKTAFSELEVTFHFGPRSVTSQSLIPSGGLIKIASHSDGVKRLVWKLPKSKKQPEIASLSGRCTMSPSLHTDPSSFLSDSNCHATVSFTGSGYALSSGVSIVSGTTDEGHPVAVMPPMMKGLNLRIWNGKASEPTASRVL